MFSDNIQYEFSEPWTIEFESGIKRVAAGTYTRRKLINLVKGEIELTQFDKNPQIENMNKLAGVIEVVFNLNELDNSNNLENGKPSNTLLVM